MLGDREETITYIPDSQNDASPICLKLLAHLQGIQLGKVKDDFNWNFEVTEEDGKKAVDVDAPPAGVLEGAR